jgi:hypothetical protein
MITIEKIRIYNYFNGDIDGWARAGTKEQKAIIQDKDWFLIEGFVQDIRLGKKGLASETYMKAIAERLSESCDSEKSIQELKNLANT